ncbi:MAG: hypothetical protein JRJ12_13595 [Deltaproteobacteria bacterium]|nr:hypothetical protein [Deltaproteobacteria bacterium]MBW2070789.1 hypothetical protein [Deltaproteobacteria bacterium]
MDLGRYLSKKDAIGLLEIVSNGLDCRREEDFRKLLLDLQDLIAFECAVCGHQNLREEVVVDQICEQKMVNVNYPVEFLE